MLKTIRVLLNNMNEKPYVKGKAGFKLYSTSEKNLTPLKKSSDPMRKIDELETTIRYDNLHLYAANMAKLRGKRATVFVLPVLLGALTIFSWAGKGYDKVETLPSYQKSVIVMDEEHLYEDTKLPDKFVFAEIDRNFSEDELAHNINSTGGSAKINFGEGERAVQVFYNVDSDGTWSYSSYRTEPYFNLDGKDKENAKEIPEKYENIISEAASIFKSQLKPNSETAALIDEILANEKNDTIVRIERLESQGKQDFVTHHNYWLLRILSIIADIVLVALLIKYRDELMHVRELSSNEGILDTGSYISIIHAVMKYREALVQAETERIKEIDTITKKNNGTGEILSNFEKKLLLK